MTETTAPHTPAPRSWIAPLISTLVTLPLGFVVLGIAGLSQMACDSCFGSEADRFEDSFATAFAVFCWGLLVPAGLLVLSWALPRQRRFAALRVLVSVLAPVAVVALYLVFSALVRWPA